MESQEIANRYQKQWLQIDCDVNYSVIIYIYAGAIAMQELQEQKRKKTVKMRFFYIDGLDT